MTRWIAGLIGAFLLGLSVARNAAAAAVAVSAAGVGPRIQLASTNYDFGQVIGGEVVKYKFVFTNTGDQLLEIKGVKSTCGCTAAGGWSRQVEPGATGSLPIEFHSANYSGKIAKTVTLTSNATNQPEVVLGIQGKVWWPIEVSPSSAAFAGFLESPSNAFTVVRIVNHEEAPLTLSAPTSSHRSLAAELKATQPGREFELIVKVVPPLGTGNVIGQITLQTSCPKMPVLKIPAWIVAQQAVNVLPAQLQLPAGPLPAELNQTVAIRCLWTNPLVLTEPVVNVKGVEGQLSELQPGRYFTVSLVFPKGFQIAPREKVELSLRSNHPQFPLIHVPIVQKPATAVVPASATP